MYGKQLKVTLRNLKSNKHGFHHDNRFGFLRKNKLNIICLIFFKLFFLSDVVSSTGSVIPLKFFPTTLRSIKYAVISEALHSRVFEMELTRGWTESFMW